MATRVGSEKFLLDADSHLSTLRVKLADNQDNRDPARVAALAGAGERVATRYEPARELLEDSLLRAAAS